MCDERKNKNVNFDLLNDELRALGYNRTVLSERSGIPYRRLNGLLNDELTWSVDDASLLCKCAGWSAKIRKDIFSF